MSVKRIILTLILAMAVGAGIILYWSYSGASGAIEFRGEMDRQGAIKYSGTTWISQSELNEIEGYLEDYPDAYTLRLLGVDGDLVEVKYFFLSLEDEFPYLKSGPIPTGDKAANSLSRIFLPIFAMAAMLFILTSGLAGKEGDSQVEG